MMTKDIKMLKKILEYDLIEFEKQIKVSDKEFDDLESQFEEDDDWKTPEDYWNEGFHMGRINRKEYIKNLLNLISDDKEMN